MPRADAARSFGCRTKSHFGCSAAPDEYLEVSVGAPASDVQDVLQPV